MQIRTQTRQEGEELPPMMATVFASTPIQGFCFSGEKNLPFMICAWLRISKAIGNGEREKEQRRLAKSGHGFFFGVLGSVPAL
jgi:hypothetical protein